MKKIQILYVLLLAVLTVAFSSCNSCGGGGDSPDEKVTSPAELLKLGAEHTIATDRQAIYLRTPKDYTLKWMQSCVTLTSFLTDESIQDATLMEVTNGFQTQWSAGDGSIYTKVTLITTNTMATDSLVCNGDFYLDNYPLNDKPILLTFQDAIDRMLEANCMKPETRLIVLRSPVGPVHVEDAYYIAGNGKDGKPMVFVNARTGVVTTKNPAWGEPKTPSEPQ